MYHRRHYTSLSFPTSYIAIRLDFSPPFGEKGYTVSEQDEYLEVCIRLASTGSHEELLSSVEVIVTYEDDSATGVLLAIITVLPPTITCIYTLTQVEKISLSVPVKSPFLVAVSKMTITASISPLLMISLLKKRNIFQ